MADKSERGQLLESLLGDCMFALEALLLSPDLMLDELEQATQDAVEVACETLQAVNNALQEGPQPGTSVAVSSSRGAATQWFILETERKTWTKYLVEAANTADAKGKADAGEDHGYRAGADESARVYGLFASHSAALESDASGVDCR